MEEFIQRIAQLDPFWIYLSIFAIAYIENLFPPAPSDTLIVFGGALSAMGQANAFITLLSCTTGSVFGFMTMYVIGRWIGRSIIEQGKLAFIPVERVHTVERWFVKYGFWLIIANRFLSGTRAVVSFFAGLSELDLFKTTLLSAVSSLAWYGILVYAGYSLGDNWELIGGYVSTYSKIITVIITAALLAWVGWYFFKSKRGIKSDA